jgi:predicted DNA-binding transcriptional regulator AlpA
MSDRRITLKELADRWSIKPATLYQWRWEGKGPPCIKVGRSVRYRLSDIEKYEEQRLNHHTSEPLKGPN